eukprot:264424-Amphidinium_carterae.2
MIDEQSDFPHVTKIALLDKRVTELTNANDYAAMLPVLCPWSAESEFDPYAPVLVACERDSKKRATKWKDVFTKTIIVPLVVRHEEGSKELLELVKVCLEQNKHVDTIDMDEATNLCWDDNMAVWRALQALLTTSLDPRFNGFEPLCAIMTYKSSDLRKTLGCGFICFCCSRAQSPFFSTKADVQRLKFCVGKTGRTSLHLVAAALDSNAGLKEKLEEYIAKSPMMLSQGGHVDKFTQTLGDIKMEPSAITTLQSVLVHLPALQQGLRSGSCDELLVLFRSRLEEVLAWAKTNGKADGALLAACSRLLMEASTLFPFDEKLQKNIQDVGLLIKNQSQEAVLQHLVDACGALACATDVTDGVELNADACLSAVFQVQEKVCNLGPGRSPLGEEHKAAIKKAVQSVYKIANAKPPTCPANMPLVESAVDAGMKLAKFAGDTSQMSEMELLSCALGLLASYVELAEVWKTHPLVSTEMLSKVVSVSRQTLLLGDMLKKPSLEGHASINLISKIQIDSKQLLDQTTHDMTSQTTTGLTKSFEALELIAGGTSDGSN